MTSSSGKQPIHNNPPVQLETFPLTPERWTDFEKLFGEKGACGGCWCMWWRLKRSDFEKSKGLQNKKAMRRIIASGEIPGLLAYEASESVGWCSVAPRDKFPVLGRSRILKPVDSQNVWSLVCLYVRKDKRRQGISEAILRAAQRYVGEQGGRILEGYPIEPKKDAIPDAFAWVGLASSFRRLGFEEVARRSETRPIMRYYVKP